MVPVRRHKPAGGPLSGQAAGTYRDEPEGGSVREKGNTHCSVAGARHGPRVHHGRLAASFAGNTRSAGYGVKANIYCPASAPYVGASGQSNWVSTPGPTYWVQAGWRYYSGYSYAKSYYEYSLPIGYNLVETSVQRWGAVRTYEVSHSGSGVWAVKINNSTVGSFGTLTAPVYPVKAMSESHYSTVQLNTQFSTVQVPRHEHLVQLRRDRLVHRQPLLPQHHVELPVQDAGPVSTGHQKLERSRRF